MCNLALSSEETASLAVELIGAVVAALPRGRYHSQKSVVIHLLVILEVSFMVDGLLAA